MYSFISVTIPRCLPKRLKTISYANEFAFLYNSKIANSILSFPANVILDKMEHLDLKEVSFLPKLL